MLLGQGSFGTVTVEDGAAVKREKPGAPRPTLAIERRVLAHLASFGPCPFLPRVLGWQPPPRAALRMELLGPSLQRVFDEDGPFDDAQALSVLNQSLMAMHAVHTRGVLHRDVSPANLCFRGDPRRGETPRRGAALVLIDFGLAKGWMRKDGSPAPPRRDAALVGTPRYSSLDAMEGRGVSRRGDLQSLFFSVAFLRAGGLPWSGKNARGVMKRDRREMIHARKTQCDEPDAPLWRGGKCMGVLRALYLSSRRLQWAEAPPYLEMARAAREGSAAHFDV